MPVRDYLEQVIDLITQSGATFRHQPQIEVGPEDESIGILRAGAEYPDGSRLDVTLVVDFSDEFPEWRYYSFHYMDSEGRCVFRYDNTPHHFGPFFPHHKHIGPDETVIDHPRPSLRQVLREIQDRLAHA